MSEAIQERESATTPKSVRLEFTGPALEELERMARDEGKRLDEIIEDAISLRKWAMQVKENKETVVVRKDRRDKYALDL